MKTFTFLFTGAAALALSACGSADDTAAEADAPDVTMVEGGEPVPTVTETTVVREGDATDGNRVSVDANGVNVDIQDGNTSVQMGEDGASISVDN